MPQYLAIDLTDTRGRVVAFEAEDVRVHETAYEIVECPDTSGFADGALPKHVASLALSIDGWMVLSSRQLYVRYNRKREDLRRSRPDVNPANLELR